MRNEGNATAGPTTTRVNSSGTITDVATPALEPGEEFELEADCVFGPDCGFRVTADFNDEVEESDEDNNSDFCREIG